ncbi:MAG: DUF167 domain-containing protein [Candidatus Melainabacteria bacterium]|nr:DUF167 domain-containing protein [Candidatus Melainabacteria bacterium]
MSITLAVKVIPKASASAIVGWEGEELKVRLKAVPEKGKANAELISFLAKVLGLSKSCFTLMSGETSRHKKLRIEGMTAEALHARLAALI